MNDLEQTNMRQDGDIGSMDYDQAVKNGEIFFGWSAWMEQDLSLIHIFFPTKRIRFSKLKFWKIIMVIIL